MTIVGGDSMAEERSHATGSWKIPAFRDPKQWVGRGEIGATMRREQRRQETRFSFSAPEARVREQYPLRTIRAMIGSGAGGIGCRARRPVLAHWTSVDPPGVPARLLALMPKPRANLIRFHGS